MAPPSRRPCSPPALMEELVEEILLRIRPDEPAHLFRAALVCKPWRRILSDSDPGFLRRYRALHGAPPLLGYFHNPYTHPKQATFPFVPAAAAPPFTPAHEHDQGLYIYRVMDCRHGRVLMRKIHSHYRSERLIVWDPITGDQKKLSAPSNCYYPPVYYSGAAVLCAVDGCDHLDCHAGAFRVVYCGMNIASEPSKTWSTVYSSETGEWSSMISMVADQNIGLSPPTLIRNALYFRFNCSISMLKYDFGGREVSEVSSSSSPGPANDKYGPGARDGVAIELDDGRLGFVAVMLNSIYTWSWQADANCGPGIWAQHMVMDLETVLPRGVNPKFCRVIGLVEGTNTIFIGMDAGLFTLDLKSRKVKKIGKRLDCCWIIPYMSFYTPDYGRFSSLVSGEAC